MNPHQFETFSNDLKAVSSWWPTEVEFAEAMKNAPRGAEPVVLGFGEIGYAVPIDADEREILPTAQGDGHEYYAVHKHKVGEFVDGGKARITAVYSNGWNTRPVTLRHRIKSRLTGRSIASIMDAEDAK